VASAVICGAMTLKQGVRTIYHRSKHQQTCEGQGGMVAISMPKPALEEILVGFEGLSIACENGPEDFVVAGDKTEVESLVELLKKDHPDVFNRVWGFYLVKHDVLILVDRFCKSKRPFTANLWTPLNSR